MEHYVIVLFSDTKGKGDGGFPSDIEPDAPDGSTHTGKVEELLATPGVFFLFFNIR